MNPDFKELLQLFNANRVAIDFDGLPVRVIALQDLITTKHAAGRPQDLQDVAGLERAREEQTE